MNTQDTLLSDDENEPVNVTILTITMPVEIARQVTANQLRRASAQPASGVAVTSRPLSGARRASLEPHWWSPFRPFVGTLAGYRLARDALDRSGLASIAYVCIAAGACAVVWRQATIPIGIAGGLLVAGILLVRTGAYREYLAAIDDTHGIPPLDVVVRYNVDYLRQRIRALWRRC